MITNEDGSVRRGTFGNGLCGDRPCNQDCLIPMMSPWDCIALVSTGSSTKTEAPKPTPKPQRPTSPHESKGRQTYLIGVEDSPMVKIGMSANPEARMTLLQIGHPSALQLMWTCNGDYERALHKHFADQRHRGEWFDLTSLGEDPAEVVARAVDEIRARTSS